jgi:CRP-like cAMP-binding protein
LYNADDICRALYIVASGTVELLVAGAEKDAMVEAPEDMRGPGSALGQLEFLFDMRQVLIYDD